MKLSSPFSKAFTLIEMLIVIVIIGILAAALIPRLQSVQGRARDSKRKVDLRTLYNANEIYKTDFSMYPKAGACGYGVPGCHTYSSSGAYWHVNITGIVSSIPLDPLNTVSSFGFFTTGTYLYTYGNVTYANGTGSLYSIDTYDMTALLENTSDPDRCAVKLYTNIGAQVCGGGFSGDWYKYHYRLSPHTIK